MIPLVSLLLTTGYGLRLDEVDFKVHVREMGWVAVSLWKPNQNNNNNNNVRLNEKSSSSSSFEENAEADDAEFQQRHPETSMAGNVEEE